LLQIFSRLPLPTKFLSFSPLPGTSSYFFTLLHSSSLFFFVTKFPCCQLLSHAFLTVLCSHMNWVLSCIEEGNEDALKPKNLSRLHGAKAGGSSVMQTKTERGLENTAIARFRKQQGLNTSSSSTVKAKNPAMDGKEQESKKNTTFRQEQLSSSRL